MRASSSSACAGAVIVALSLMPTSIAQAAPGEWDSPPIAVSAPTSDSVAAPQVVTDGATITALWTESGDSSAEVQVAHSVDQGATWSTPTTLSGPAVGFTDTQVVTDGATITVLWSLFDGNSNVIQATSSTDGGETWRPVVALTPTDEYAVAVDVVTSGGTVTAVWERFEDFSSNKSIQSSSSEDGGQTWSDIVTISEGTDDAENPVVVSDGDTITVAWERFVSPFYRIQASSSTDGGETWSPAEYLSGDSNAQDAQLVTDGTTITAIWSRNVDTVTVIQSSSLTEGETSWSEPVTLSADGVATADPQLVTNGSTITAIWSTQFPGSIQSSSSNDGGATWSAPVTITDPGESGFASQLVTDGTTITAIWSDVDSVQTSSSDDGGATWSAPLQLSAPGADDSEPQLATGGGTITVVWPRFDDSTGESVVRASSFTAVDDDPELAATGVGGTELGLGILAAGLLVGGAVLLTARGATRDACTPA